jgi:hypothetical protein
MSRMTFLTIAGARSLAHADPGLRLPGPRSHHAFTDAGEEPSLRAMIRDPLTKAVMARDNVTINDLQAVVREARARLRAREEAA